MFAYPPTPPAINSFGGEVKEGINIIATLAVIAFLIAAAIVEEKEGTSYAGACMIVFVFLSFVVAPIGVILLVLLKLL